MVKKKRDEQKIKKSEHENIQEPFNTMIMSYECNVYTDQ